ncbi:MAG: flagellar filament capping protein FliD [Clostridiales bacterium]|nr:flagellar filament capping protein FliD [Clostridiales bacterium]
MPNNISNIINTQLRFSGMASGLDTDYIVEQMMRVEWMKVDSYKQDKQILEWKREDYRNITNLLRSFKDEFFDLLRPASNMRSSSTYYAYKVNYSDENVVTATANGQVVMTEHTIEVIQLAEKAKMESGSGAFGAEGLNLSSSISEVADKLGIDLTEDKLVLTINGETIEIEGSKKFSDLISAINNSEAGVRISYSSFLDKFFIESKATGADAKIDITESSDFFEKLGFDIGTDPEVVAYGKDAEFILDSKTATRSSNMFTIDGVTYSLTGIGTTTIKLTQDTDAIFNKIKSFIDKYNEIVTTITDKVNESRPKSGGTYGSYYLPLTEEQKQAMSEKDIELWEEKAKQGLLKNDALLSGIVQRMRSIMGDITESGGLFSIGISTGNWREGAKLFIDENKLKKAIEENPDRVMEIFARQSSISYDPDNSREDRKTRYDESGVVERLFDVIQNYIRTTRNNDGKKGLLLEKAGIIGDVTEFQNTISKEINDKELYIQDLIERLYIKQESLYIKFAALETALSRMNAQAAWLSQSLGSAQR